MTEALKQIDSSNYVEFAMRTDNKYGEDVMLRLTNPALLKNLHHLMKLTSSVGELADISKRYIFYGSPVFNHVTPVDKHLKKYDTDELKTRMADLPFVRLLHSAIGLITEIGELIDILYAFLFHGKALDMEHIAEEYGDKYWYLALGQSVLDIPMNAVLLANIMKLAERYPDGFEEVRALVRNLDAERLALNGGITREVAYGTNDSAIVGGPMDIRTFFVEVGVDVTDQQIDELRKLFAEAEPSVVMPVQAQIGFIDCMDHPTEEGKEPFTLAVAISEFKDALQEDLEISVRKRYSQMADWLEELELRRRGC